MKAIGYTVLAIAAAASLVFANVLKPNSAGATAFIALWLLLPYAALALALMFAAKARPSAMAYIGVTVVVSVSGLLFLADVIFHRLAANMPLAHWKSEHVTRGPISSRFASLESSA